MVFSNNMEYDDDSIDQIEGAFYATSSYDKPFLHYFREEEAVNLDLITPENEAIENAVLKDNNLAAIKTNSEFITNKNYNTPTNRICTSLLQKKRLAFLLQYAIAYANNVNGIEKHIMRYPQIFATKAIENKLNQGVKKGIIWHTQGSGKTALAYYNVKFLTDYFSKQGIIPKFYFIVDRIDLKDQASREFSSRGLIVHQVNSRDEFAKEIKSTSAIHNDSGKAEITVVNIQKFKDDSDIIATDDYDLNLQRVYFLDEVHRSYNPQGSFLASLNQSDKNAVKIGLTGTPLLGDDYNSRVLFGDYIHKYYYNASIADGYTLRLIREEIATNYRMALQQALADAEVLAGDINKKAVYAHPRFVEPMLDYIIEDFTKSRIALGDSDIGGMVICDSSEQAKQMFAIFEAKYKLQLQDTPQVSYIQQKQQHRVKSAALILHDIGTKEERKQQVEDFKDGKIDFLFVYNMLLTGFDAKRLKKLYLGRLIKKHNLLQALTRVNRTYKDFRYGYIVDFADITEEFEATNKAYFDELQSELGDEVEHYSNLFKSETEITEEIENIKDTLFRFDTANAEIFSQQIIQIKNRAEVQEIKKALDNARSLYNTIRSMGYNELLAKLDFQKLNQLYRETSNHLALLNLKEKIENSQDTTNLLNSALEEVVFMFAKVGESELVLAETLKDTLRKTREALASSCDRNDPKYIKLREELERLFRQQKLTEVSQNKMKLNIASLKEIYQKIKELNRQDNLLKAKYQGDAKYTRIHKRLLDSKKISQSERRIFEVLQEIKADADNNLLENSQIINNESYFERMIMRIAVTEFKQKANIPLKADTFRYISDLIVQEYLNEVNDTEFRATDSNTIRNQFLG